MSIIDWFVILIFLVLVAVGKTGINAVSLIFLVIVIIIERVIFERHPFAPWTTRPAP